MGRPRSTALRRASPCVEKRPHVEGRLRRIVSRLAPHRARVPGEASRGETSHAGTALDVRDAPRNIVATRGECPDRTRRETRAVRAALAGAGTIIAGRKIQTFAKRDRAPVGVPQAEVRVHERPDGRGIHGTRPLRPSDERQPGRTSERKERGTSQVAREPRNDPAAPAIQGVRRAVVRFIRCRESGPHSGTGVAHENQRCRGGAIRKRRNRIVGHDVKRTPAREPFGLDGHHDGFEGPRGCFATVSGVFHARTRQAGRTGEASHRACRAGAPTPGSAGVPPAWKIAGLRPVAGGTPALPGTPRAIPGWTEVMMAPRGFLAVVGTPKMDPVRYS